MKWSKIWFGKYKGKTLPQLIFADPDYFYWTIDDGVFENRGAISAEAKEVYRKSTNIHIPQTGRTKFIVEYDFDQLTGKFCGLEILPSSHPKHIGSTITVRSHSIDMSVPRQRSKRDKLGNKRLISDLKYHLFGNEKLRMTKRVCEKFFEDDNNFDL